MMPEIKYSQDVEYFFRNDFVAIRRKQHRVIVKMSGTATDDQIEEYLQAMKRLYSENKPFLIVYDTSTIGHLSLTQIHRQATFMQEMESQTRIIMKRAAVLVQTALFKNILNKLFVFRPPATDLEVFNNMKDCQEYLSKCSYQFK